MEPIRRFISFLAGLFLVLIGILSDCPRVGAIAVGLLLMGMFTVPEALTMFHGKMPENRTKTEDAE